MKKWLPALLLVLCLCLSCALASGTDGRGDMIARSGELSAFCDGSGKIYISGLGTPVNTTPADSVLSIDAYRILFFAEDGSLISIDLNRNFAETIVSKDAAAACADGEMIYYISATDPEKLMSYDLDSRKRTTLFTAGEALSRVYMSRDGLIVTLIDDACAYIYDELRGAFVEYGGPVATELYVDEDYDVFLTEEQELYFSDKADTAELIDSSVRAWCVVDGEVCYLSGYGENVLLKNFDIENRLRGVLLQPGANMKTQLTASADKLFMLSEDNIVYRVNRDAHKLERHAELAATSSYALGNGKKLDSYRIEAVSGQLNIYGILGEAGDALPTFSFVAMASDTGTSASSGASEVRLLSAYAIEDEATVKELLEPAKQYTPLRKGSRGEVVSALQDELLRLGYYDYNIDGIFGWRTDLAIRMLQEDLGMPVNGVADAELQKLILSGKLDPYDPYKALSRGSRGSRVREMQQRLRDLGYLADGADGIFGPRTETAVALFQEENGLKETGVADQKTLKLLYSKKAESCSSYIDLYRGDSGYRVRELNRRLRELYYLDGKVSSNYNSATERAVRLFQQEVSMKSTGSATVAVQKKLFAKKAPEYSGYITLRRGDDNERVKRLQKRLKELKYYTGKVTGYFDKATKEAVTLFQRAVHQKATGVATPEMQEALFDRHAPEYNPHKKITEPEITLDAYTSFKKGFYTISDSDTDYEGNVKAYWYTDGDVAYHSLKIVDDRGSVYLDIDEMPLDTDFVNIPLLALDPTRTYTFTVTAYPIDKKGDKARSASISFIRKEGEPEPDPEKKGEIDMVIVQPVAEDYSYKDGIYYITDESFSFEWYATPASEVRGYAYEISEPTGSPIIRDDSISEKQSVDVKAGVLEKDKNYTVTVYAVPKNGEMKDSVNETITFAIRSKVPEEDNPVLPPEEETPEENEPVIAPEEEPEEDEPVLPPEEEPEADEPVIAPEEEEPVVTPEEEEPEEDEPVLPPEDESESEPVGAPEIGMTPVAGSFEAAYGKADVEVLIPEGDSITFSWPAEGDVSVYAVRISDGEGNTVLDRQLENDSAKLPASNLVEGVVYKLSVDAIGKGGEKVGGEPLYFGKPIKEEPAPEEEPVEEPEEDYDDEREEEPVEEPEEDYDDEPEEEPIEEPEEDYDDEPEEEPVEEPEEDYDEPEEEAEEDYYEEPEEEPAPEKKQSSGGIDAGSDYEAIADLQYKLIDRGYLSEDDCSIGTLDDATVEAVIAFQNDKGLPTCDPDDPVIDSKTLKKLG